MEPTAVHSTFVIERTYPAAPDRVFAAFSDPTRKRRWFVEGDHAVEEYEMDFRVGGQERAQFRFNDRSPLKGLACTNRTIYQDIVPDRRLVFASTMSLEGRCFSATLVTVEFLPAKNGTELILTHQGAFFENSDGPEMREHGWRKLMERLEAEFPAVNA